MNTNESDLKQNIITIENNNMRIDNNDYFNSHEENFQNAISLMEKDFSDSKLYELLKFGNLPEKQIAALKIKKISSQQEADIFLNNLTGQDGKIREAVSLRISEFASDENNLKYLISKKACDIFLDAIIDINGNICRNIINCITYLKKSSEFCTYFIKELLKKTHLLLDEVKDLDLQEGKYKVNKSVFKLYWCLETISELTNEINVEEFIQLLTISKSINDYTIREKTAKILHNLKINNPQIDEIRSELKKDPNYYVRRFHNIKNY